MSFRVIRAIAQTENQDDIHLGRLLLLLNAADKRTNKTIEGITKLAKLDFLLRYPNCLERALLALNKNAISAAIKDFERTTIEAKMIRFKYGPWDDRYRRWIGLLVARGLVDTFVKGKTVHVGLTDKGREVASIFTSQGDFEDIAARSKIIISAVGSLSATRIKDFVYQTFPELETLKWGEEIEI